METTGPGPTRRPGYLRSVLHEIGHTLTHAPAIRSSDRRILAFLLVTFVVVFSLLGVTFYLFTGQLREPVPSPIRFATPTMSSGNASLLVSQVDGGPYPAAGFSMGLSVNNFASPDVPLPQSNVSVSLAVGNVMYRLSWTDVDRDGSVSVGDRFSITGSGSPLPSLSYFAFRLVWEGAGTASVFWTTSSE